MDKLYAVRFLKIFFFKIGDYDTASAFRLTELDIMNELCIESISEYKIRDLTSLTKNQVKEVEKIIDNKSLLSVNWDYVSDGDLLKLRREIKLNHIFK